MIGRRREPRVWVVTEPYYPDEVSTGLLLTQLAEALGKHFDVKVLCAQPTYSAHGVRAPKFERVNGVDIYRCPSTTFHKDRLPGRALNTLSFTLSVLAAAIGRFRRGDLALVCTQPPTLPFIVSFAARLRGARSMLVVHDVYPDVAVAVGAIRPDGLVERVAGALARWPYRTMTSIVALTSDMAALIERRCPEVADKLAVIPNWADLDVISPSDADGKAFLHELGLTDRFVVQYSGNIGRSHGIEAIADVAERLRDDPQIRFLVVGSGAKRDWLVATIDEKRLTNVTVLPRQPRDALNGLLNGCDVGILAMVPGMLGISSPSRLYNIFAAGKPVFAMVDAHSHVADVVESEGVGWVMEPGDVDELERRIREAAADAIGVREKGTKARAVAEQQFSRDHITDEYARLVRDVMER